MDKDLTPCMHALFYNSQLHTARCAVIWCILWEFTGVNRVATVWLRGNLRTFQGLSKYLFEAYSSDDVPH